MIAFKDGLPLFERSRGLVTAFKGDWLRQALQRAARKAGYSEFWLAEDLTCSVVYYLRFHYSDNVIAAPNLTNAVRIALRQIGYDEIAQHFGGRAFPRKIYLPQLISGDESEACTKFFRRLANRIRLSRPNNGELLCFLGLDECVALMPPVSTAGVEHRKLEIIEFVHQQLLTLGGEDVRVLIS